MSNEGEDKIGYGRPPASTRFKPGQSGNPKGRPKGSKDFKSIIQEELDSPILVTENGQRKKITRRRAMVIQQANRAAGGDVKATAFLYNADQASQAGGDGLSRVVMRAEDNQTAEGILDRLRAFDAARTSESSSGTAPQGPVPEDLKTDASEPRSIANTLEESDA